MWLHSELVSWSQNPGEIGPEDFGVGGAMEPEVRLRRL